MYNHQLDTFVAAAECGSFAKAAENLYLSAPAVFQQIKQLEKNCGFSLFDRTNHGIKLTEAGQSLYYDTKQIIQLSKEALERAKHLADDQRVTVRIGTSYLFKCRLLMELWPQIRKQCPQLEMQIYPITEANSRLRSNARLGIDFDIQECVIPTIAQRESTEFLELTKVAVSCAVQKTHPLAGRKSVRLDELKDETIVLPIQHISEELDDFRRDMTNRFPDIRIIESDYYGMDTFTLCELNSYVLITQEILEDVHTNLVTVPLESDYRLPYGLLYSKKASPATLMLLEEIRKILKKDNDPG